MAKYRITIDQDACVSDRLCGEKAPATFALDENNKGMVADPEGDPPEDILEAAQSCRMNAIILHDKKTGEKVWPLG